MGRGYYPASAQGTRMASDMPWSFFLSAGTMVARTPPRWTDSFDEGSSSLGGWTK